MSERIRKRMPNYPWPPAAVALLGTDTDINVAASLGINLGSVSTKRLKLGIKAFHIVEPLKIPDHLITQLGVTSDSQIARQLGVSQSAVSQYRRRLGKKPIIEAGTLPPEADAFLGKLNDVQVAKKFNVSNQCVHKRRHKLGIAKAPAPVRKKANLELPTSVIERMGKCPDQELAKETGISAHAFTQARLRLGIKGYVQTGILTAEAIAELGTNTDAFFAQKYNVTEPTIHRTRRVHDIPSYRSQRTKPKLPDEALALLSKRTDADIAAMVPGFSEIDIRLARKTLGIGSILSL